MLRFFWVLGFSDSRDLGVWGFRVQGFRAYVSAALVFGLIFLARVVSRE